MSEENHYRKLERMYVHARCNEYYAPHITVTKGTAEVIVPVKADFFHAAHAVHGSVYFKMLDDAGFFAANSLVLDYLVLTTSFTLYFLKPITSGELRATGKVVHSSKRLFISECSLCNSENMEIARGSGTFIQSVIKLTPEIGYI